jgi:hypothetical protein
LLGHEPQRHGKVDCGHGAYLSEAGVRVNLRRPASVAAA